MDKSMPLDEFGLYVSGLVHPNLSGSASETDGDPNGVHVGSPNDWLFDPTTRTFWYKESGTGTNTGWIESHTLPS